jgi:hypothetical protein
VLLGFLMWHQQGPKKAKAKNDDEWQIAQLVGFIGPWPSGWMIKGVFPGKLFEIAASGWEVRVRERRWKGAFEDG